MRLNAYYYGFDATGVREIDVVLSAVACAGKAYHHTESWTDEGDDGFQYEDAHRGNTCALWIQNAAADAAEHIRGLESRLAVLDDLPQGSEAKAAINRCVQLQDRVRELETAIDGAFQYSNGRVSEWGERAEECFAILELARREKGESDE